MSVQSAGKADFEPAKREIKCDKRLRVRKERKKAHKSEKSSARESGRRGKREWRSRRNSQRAQRERHPSRISIHHTIPNHSVRTSWLFFFALQPNRGRNCSTRRDPFSRPRSLADSSFIFIVFASFIVLFILLLSLQQSFFDTNTEHQAEPGYAIALV